MKQSFHYLFIPFSLILLIFSAITTGIAAQEAQEQAPRPPVEGIVDTETGLKELFLALNTPEGGEIDPELIYVIEGVVSAREILQPAEMGFIGLLEITKGEWQGLDDVVAYRCYVELEGAWFEPLIPAGRQRNPGPREIPLTSRVLVFGTYLGYSGGEDGGVRYPFLQGQAVRLLK
jgi:hypothetical protein